MIDGLIVVAAHPKLTRLTISSMISATVERGRVCTRSRTLMLVCTALFPQPMS